jgi:hypothetical protein
MILKEHYTGVNSNELNIYVVDAKMKLPSAEYTATDTTWAVAAGQLFLFYKVA